jgi:hypothetical protein
MNSIALETMRSSHGIPLPSNWMPGTEKTSEDRAKLHILASLLGGDDGWCDQIKKENAQAFASGQQIPGFKLVSRAGNWRVDNQDAVLVWLRDQGMSEEQLWEYAKVNAKKAVEALAEANAMRDAASMMSELASVGAVSQGDPIMYLKKSYKGSDAEQLKGMIQ